jgi:hypothetical protein
MLSALEPFLSSSPKSSIAGKGYGTRNGARPRTVKTTHGLQQPAQDKPLGMYYCLIAPNPLRKAPCPPPYRLWCSPPVPSPTIQPLNPE